MSAPRVGDLGVMMPLSLWAELCWHPCGRGGYRPRPLRALDGKSEAGRAERSSSSQAGGQAGSSHGHPQGEVEGARRASGAHASPQPSEDGNSSQKLGCSEDGLLSETPGFPARQCTLSNSKETANTGLQFKPSLAVSHVCK